MKPATRHILTVVLCFVFFSIFSASAHAAGNVIWLLFPTTTTAKTSAEFYGGYLKGDAVTVECRLDSEIWFDCLKEEESQPGVLTTIEARFENLSYGSHTMTVRVNGNIEDIFTWSVEKEEKPPSAQLYVTTTDIVDEQRIYRASIKLEYMTNYRRCVENGRGTVWSCARQPNTIPPEILQANLTEEERETAEQNNSPEFMERLDSLVPAVHPLSIKSVNLNTDVRQDNAGYEGLKRRVAGTEQIIDDCPNVLQRNDSCSIELTINLAQQPGELDSRYWRRLESYIDQTGLKVEVTTNDGQEASPDRIITPDLDYFLNIFSDLRTQVGNLATKIIFDKCKWVEEEPWLYHTILNGYVGSLEERKVAAGCFPEEPKKYKPGLPVIIDYPGSPMPGKYKIFANSPSLMAGWGNNLVASTEASRQPFRWVSYEQIKSSGTKYMDAESRSLYLEDFHQWQLQFDPTTKFRCRVSLIGKGGGVVRDWFSCEPGLKLNLPPIPTQLHHYSLEVQAGNAAGWGGTTSVIWKPLDTNKCLISDARSRFFIYAGKRNNNVRLVTRYKARKAGKVKVVYFKRKKNGKPGKRLGALQARFAAGGSRKSKDGYKTFRIKQRRKPALMRKLRKEKFGFVAKMRVVNAPAYCNRYYRTDVELSEMRRFYGQYTWFQKGSFTKNRYDFIPLSWKKSLNK